MVTGSCRFLPFFLSEEGVAEATPLLLDDGLATALLVVEGAGDLVTAAGTETEKIKNLCKWGAKEREGKLVTILFWFSNWRRNRCFIFKGLIFIDFNLICIIFE